MVVSGKSFSRYFAIILSSARRLELLEEKVTVYPENRTSRCWQPEESQGKSLA
jgi:hypothetical protein